jgi:predicted ATPase
MAAVRELMAKADEKELEAAAKAFVGAIKRGSFQHAREYIEREEGKVPDRHAGADGSDIVIRVVHEERAPATDAGD